MLSHGPAQAATPACPAGLLPTKEIDLYFGRDIEHRGEVTERQFQAFVERVITPSFPDGFTVTDAQGHYRYRDGRIVRERTKIVSINETPATDNGHTIDNIIRSYKQSFDQEKVLEEQRIFCAKLE